MSASASSLGQRPARLAQTGTTEPRWVRCLLLAVALGFMFLFLVLPLAAVFAEALRKGASAYLDAFKEPDAWIVSPIRKNHARAVA